MLRELRSVFGLRSGLTQLGRRLATAAGNCNIDIDKCNSVMLQLVDKAAELMREASKQQRTFQSKGNSKDLVTATDGQIETLLIEGLKQHFPEHIYIGEEGTAGMATGSKLSHAPTWIIDPIDGTMNFVHGFPYTCISVGFWLHGQPELAICYNPMLELRFTARRGCGARLNDAPMQISGQNELRYALVLHELNAANLQADYFNIQLCNARKMLQNAHALRTCGSAAMDLCLVAMGAADGYYEFYPHAWDMAAGALLVLEAGGVLLDPSGGKFDLMSRRVLAAATPQLGCQMVQVLGDMQIYHKRDDA